MSRPNSIPAVGDDEGATLTRPRYASRLRTLRGNARCPVRGSGAVFLEVMPRRCIREIRVVLDKPSLAAAPSQPPSTQFVPCSVATIWSRSVNQAMFDDLAGASTGRAIPAMPRSELTQARG